MGYKKTRRRVRKGAFAGLGILVLLVILAGILLVQKRNDEVREKEMWNSLETTADHIELPVENILQRPELPNGCEVTALAVLLRYLGFPADKCDLSDHYLPKMNLSTRDGVEYGPDPEQYYAGDPRENTAFYCFTQPIVEAANSYLADQNSNSQAKDISGCSFDDIKRYLREGKPVLMWVTLYAEEPRVSEKASWIIEGTGELYRPYVNLHCVVISGYDSDRFLMMANPMYDDSTGNQYSQEMFLQAFEQLGSRAVVIE